jgi:hypothetical protein
MAKSYECVKKTGLIVARKWLYPSQTAKTVRLSKNVKLSRKKDKNMKKSMLATLTVAGACALIAFAPKAQATIITVATDSDLLSATGTGATITVASTVTQDTSTGIYTYTYALTDGTQDLIDAFSVYFNTVPAGAVLTVTGGTSSRVPQFDVAWTFNPEVNPTGVIVSFTSDLAPTTGFAAALDNDSWGGSSGALQVGTVDIPHVPDGGLTLAMIGCVFMGIAGIRSRLDKRA